MRLLIFPHVHQPYDFLSSVTHCQAFCFFYDWFVTFSLHNLNTGLLFLLWTNGKLVSDIGWSFCCLLKNRSSSCYRLKFVHLSFMASTFVPSELCSDFEVWKILFLFPSKRLSLLLFTTKSLIPLESIFGYGFSLAQSYSILHESCVIFS
jgi:hypothetical protein